jgi:hypothetical protein
MQTGHFGIIAAPRAPFNASDRAGVALNQRCNQTQEFLLLWSAAGRNEKGSDLNVGHLPATWKPAG